MLVNAISDDPLDRTGVLKACYAALVASALPEGSFRESDQPLLRLLWPETLAKWLKSSSLDDDILDLMEILEVLDMQSAHRQHS